MAYAIITGASGGIGLCMADELALRNYDLLLIARSEAKLKQECERIRTAYGVTASWLALDLSVPSAVSVIEQWIETTGHTPEVFINNAGYGLWNPVENSSAAELENMMQLNMNALVQLSHRMIPWLRKNKTSYLLNVASTAAYQAVPTLATYAATKAFVVLFTRGLRWELRGTGVSVSCLSPGATTTGFVDRAGMVAEIKKKADKVSMTPEAVAKIAIRGMFNRKAEIIPGFINWISVKATYFLPKALIERIAAGLYKTK